MIQRVRLWLVAVQKANSRMKTWGSERAESVTAAVMQLEWLSRELQYLQAVLKRVAVGSWTMNHVGRQGRPAWRYRTHVAWALQSKGDPKWKASDCQDTHQKGPLQVETMIRSPEARMVRVFQRVCGCAFAVQLTG